MVAFGGRSLEPIDLLATTTATPVVQNIQQEQQQPQQQPQQHPTQVNQGIPSSRGRPRLTTPTIPKYFPKYLNSAESDAFKKRELLYGLNLAREFISKDGFGIVVEGYFDVLSLSELGFQNAVGCLGTAISVNQLELLAKCSKQRKVVLLMDNDGAGVTATMRICERVSVYYDM